MGEAPLVDIVIPSLATSREAPPHLRLCLDSLRDFTDVPSRVLLETSGRSAAVNRNRALARGTAPFVCFLDDDAWVTGQGSEGAG